MPPESNQIEGFDEQSTRLRQISKFRIDKFGASVITMRSRADLELARIPSWFPPLFPDLRAQEIITTQPVNKTVAIGDTVKFSVTATGGTPLSYQ